MTTLDLEQLMVISFSASKISLGEDDDEVDEEEADLPLYDDTLSTKKIDPFALVDMDNEEGDLADGDEDSDPLVGDEEEEDDLGELGFSESEE